MDSKHFDRALELARQGQCIRRNYGCVIVEGLEIISEGYTQMPPNMEHCSKEGCLREKNHIPSGRCYELCRSVHAEQVALIKADPMALKGADLYLVGVDSFGELLSNPFVCDICKKMVMMAGLNRVYIMYNAPASFMVNEKVRTEYVKDYVV